jgi:hypothetical protein
MVRGRLAGLRQLPDYKDFAEDAEQDHRVEEGRAGPAGPGIGDVCLDEDRRDADLQLGERLALGLEQQTLGLLALGGVRNEAVEQPTAGLDESRCQGGQEGHGAISTHSARRGHPARGEGCLAPILCDLPPKETQPRGQHPPVERDRIGAHQGRAGAGTEDPVGAHAQGRLQPLDRAAGP